MNGSKKLVLITVNQFSTLTIHRFTLNLLLGKLIQKSIKKSKISKKSKKFVKILNFRQGAVLESFNTLRRHKMKIAFFD